MTHSLLTVVNIVVFASGSGTNFQSIIDAVNEGQINGYIRGLVANKPNIGAIKRAQKYDIDYVELAPSHFASQEAYSQKLLSQLEDWETELIALAGYLLKIPTEVIDKYEGRMVNIHPALLPKYGGKGFYGMNVHRAVIENEETQSGCTVHLVTKEYDAGPILAQRKVPVHKNDDAASLAERILQQEHELFPEVIAKLAEEITSN